MVPDSGHRAQRILEIGTGAGVSTIVIADAARLVGGRLDTINVREHPELEANLRRAGVAGGVHHHVLGAAPFLRAADPESFDLVFLDAERSEYLAHADDLLSALAVGG